MLFSELILSTSEETVVNELVNRGLSEASVSQYKRLYVQLRSTKPEQNPMLLLVAKQKDLFSDEDSVYYGVFGVDTDIRAAFAIEFIPRAQWLGMTVCEKSVEELGAAVFIVECMREIAMLSFDESNVQKELERLRADDEAIKRGEMETYPAEEVFAQLREKYGFSEPPEKTPEEKDAEQQRIRDALEWNDNEIRRLSGIDILSTGVGTPIAET